jgi:hypothetical protein
MQARSWSRDRFAGEPASDGKRSPGEPPSRNGGGRGEEGGVEIAAGRQSSKRALSDDDRYALAERIINLERQHERDCVELAEIRTALLRRPRD